MSLVLELPDLVEPTSQPQQAGGWPVMSLAAAEALTVRAAMEASRGDKTQAAKTLGDLADVAVREAAADGRGVEG